MSSSSVSVLGKRKSISGESSFDLVEWGEKQVRVRKADGWVDGKELCMAGGRDWSDWKYNDSKKVDGGIINAMEAEIKVFFTNMPEKN